jgi:putative intracellular protease/amidase
VTYQGAPLLKGKHVTGFTNGEEEEMHLTKVVPFLVEDELMRLGAIFEKLADWQPLSIVDGRLITGRNPVSSTVAAQNLMNLLAAAKKAA